MASNDDFWDYLVALSSDFCYSNPFLYLFSMNFDPNKGLLKSPLFVIFYFRVKLCPLFQSLLFGVFSVMYSQGKNFSIGGS